MVIKEKLKTVETKSVEHVDFEIKIPYIVDLVEMVKNNRLVSFDIGEVDKVSKVLEPYMDHLHNYDPDNYPDQVDVSKDTINSIWRGLMQDNSGVEAVHAMINRYNPGNRLVLHTDFNGTSTFEDYSPVESLTFIYVVSGEKEIDFYFNGTSGGPTIIKQTPGTLYVFQGGTFKFENGDVAHALPHEVRVQDTHNTILTWEVMQI